MCTGYNNVSNADWINNYFLYCSVDILHFFKKEWNLKFFCGVIVVFLTSAVINPLFSHRGSTLLFYLFTGNPVTLESIVYGVATAGIICAMIMWFGSFNIIITTDKILASSWEDNACNGNFVDYDFKVYS